MTRVLVIDDEPAIADVLRMLLEFRGHEVLTADDGSRGFATARRQSPDVIVLDLMMPVMDGWEFREHQKKDPDLARIPVIVTSASETSVDANALLRKPIDRDALLRALEQHTSRA